MGYPWQGTSQQGYPPARSDRGEVPQQGYPQVRGTSHPARSDRGYLRWGTPGRGRGTPPASSDGGYLRWDTPSRVPPGWTWPGLPTPQLDLARVLHLWTDRWMDGQTRVKTLPSRRTTYAVGKNQKALNKMPKYRQPRVKLHDSSV